MWSNREEYKAYHREYQRKRRANLGGTYRKQHAEYNKAYYHKHSEKQKERSKRYYHANKRQEKDRKLRRGYGINIEIYDRMVAEQNGSCAICGCTPGRFCVDHDHETKEVRGLLCNTCNRGIGLLKDDPVILSKAIEYLIH
jgi:hypothetical protein